MAQERKVPPCGIKEGEVCDAYFPPDPRRPHYVVDIHPAARIDNRIIPGSSTEECDKRLLPYHILIPLPDANYPGGQHPTYFKCEQARSIHRPVWGFAHTHSYYTLSKDDKMKLLLAMKSYKYLVTDPYFHPK